MKWIRRNIMDAIRGGKSVLAGGGNFGRKMETGFGGSQGIVVREG